jgi:hypothetical protein
MADNYIGWSPDFRAGAVQWTRPGREPGGGAGTGDHRRPYQRTVRFRGKTCRQGTADSAQCFL